MLQGMEDLPALWVVPTLVPPRAQKCPGSGDLHPPLLPHTASQHGHPRELTLCQARLMGAPKLTLARTPEARGGTNLYSDDLCSA